MIEKFKTMLTIHMPEMPKNVKISERQKKERSVIK